ncbi:hypothetical protein Hanom_Chr03g00241211 [Helianthus anomalus]
MYIPKNFNRTGGSKTYIPKNFYTKTTYITLLSEKFGGSGAPPRLFYTLPPTRIYLVRASMGMEIIRGEQNNRYNRTTINR